MNGAEIADSLPAAFTATDTDRLAALFDTHYDRLYGLARRLTRSRDAAQDLVQETFLRAARASASIPATERDQEAWLVRILVNIRRDEWRRRSIRARHDARTGAGAPGGVDPEARLVARAAIWRALECLPPRRRAVVVMHELEGESVQTVARLLGIAAVTVRWHLSRGRAELARVLVAAPRGLS